MRVHDSQAYRKMDVTSWRINRILELRDILLSFQTGSKLVNAAVVCVILFVASCFESLMQFLYPSLHSPSVAGFGSQAFVGSQQGFFSEMMGQ